jgi:hypothetical protein
MAPSVPHSPQTEAHRFLIRDNSWFFYRFFVQTSEAVFMIGLQLLVHCMISTKLYYEFLQFWHRIYSIWLTASLMIVHGEQVV